MTKNNFKLIEEIIKLSENKTWDKAREEWKIINIYENKSFEICLCGHYPIKEVIIIENVNNKNSTKIGNCCINKFFQIKIYNKFFLALYKNKINAMIIEEAFKKEIINNWEKDFLLKIWRKRKLTEKQSNLLTKLKNKILIEFKK